MPDQLLGLPGFDGSGMTAEHFVHCVAIVFCQGLFILQWVCLKMGAKSSIFVHGPCLGGHEAPSICLMVISHANVSGAVA